MTALRALAMTGLLAACAWAIAQRPWQNDAIAAWSEPAAMTARAPSVRGPSAGTSTDVRRLLEEIERRGRALDAREAEVEARAATLEALERSVTDAVARLDGSSLEPGHPGSCRMRGGVTKIYETMRPDQAAAILDRLDDETLRVVFARMETKQVAAIFAEMSRERAVAFTRTLALDAPIQTASRERR